MNKTIFRVAKMDCPSEEHMIRMKLSDVIDIKSLEFDVAQRQLTVYHHGAHNEILQRLDQLNFDTTFLESNNVEDVEILTTKNDERKLLWQVLAINFFFFVLELTTGLLASSMGLVADSLDMFADAIVYILALWAVGGSVLQKKKVAKWAGYFQLALAILGFVEVVRRFLGLETLPNFQTMMIISSLALVGNALCLYLLQKAQSKEAHMQASMIFTSNDVIVNVGVIVAGALVYFTQSKYPDLIIGTLIFFIVGQGAIKILKLSE